MNPAQPPIWFLLLFLVPFACLNAFIMQSYVKFVLSVWENFK